MSTVLRRTAAVRTADGAVLHAVVGADGGGAVQNGHAATSRVRSAGTPT